MTQTTARAIAAIGAVLFFGGAALAGPGAPGHTHDSYGAGEPGDAKKPARIVPVRMTESEDGKMLYFPPKLEVKSGDQIRFKITNAGKTDHEFMLDTPEHNATHKAAMEKHPNMVHDDPNGVTIEPGKGAEIVWKFSKAGTYEYACLIPGHYEAGMHAAVTVR